MGLKDLTKAQLVEKLRREEKLTAQLEIDLEDARRRAGEEQDHAIQAVQLANRANSAVETFRFLQEGSERTERSLSNALDNVGQLQRDAVAMSRLKSRVIERLRKLSGPVVICPRCGDVQRSEEHDVLLCSKCMAERTLSERRD